MARPSNREGSLSQVVAGKKTIFVLGACAVAAFHGAIVLLAADEVIDLLGAVLFHRRAACGDSGSDTHSRPDRDMDGDTDDLRRSEYSQLMYGRLRPYRGAPTSVCEG